MNRVKTRLKFSLRELETFVAIADYGTFAAAGEVVGLTQSAISLQIKALEAALGTELFDRGRRPPVMSRQGLRLVRRAREIIQQCHSLEDDLQIALPGGSLHIGVIPTIMSGMLPATLSKLNDTHPSLMIQLSSGLSAELVSRVSRGTLDAAIVTEPARLGRGISWHTVAEETLVLIAPEHAQGDVDTELLENYPFIQFHPDTYAGQQIQALLQDRGIRVDTRMNLDSLESIAEMVAGGLGVSVVPRRLIPQPFPPGVRVLPFGSQEVKRIVGIVERVNNPKSETIQVLTSALLEQSAG